MPVSPSDKKLWFALLALSLTLPLGACVEREVVYRSAPPPPQVVEAEAVVTVREAPPPLPVYEQPEGPGDGYIWTPGYWAWNDSTYFWVPGTWVLPPRAGVLWTPGYWGSSGAVFVFHAGYWGPHVGFYGGINYGYGYGGAGYDGGRWEGEHFSYNRVVNNVNVNVVHTTYNTTVINNTVINNTTVNNVSYNGGSGGTAAQPTPQDQATHREPHFKPTLEQAQHEHAASNNRALFVSENHGAPPIAATPRAGAFNDRAVVPARQAPSRPGNGGPNAGNAFQPQSGNAPQAHADTIVKPEPQPSNAPPHRVPERAIVKPQPGKPASVQLRPNLQGQPQHPLPRNEKGQPQQHRNPQGQPLRPPGPQGQPPQPPGPQGKAQPKRPHPENEKRPAQQGERQQERY